MNANIALKLLTIAFIAFITLLIENIGILPVYFDDETRYSFLSRFVPFSESNYPMYLYFAVYSLTSFAQEHSYFLAKKLFLKKKGHHFLFF